MIIKIRSLVFLLALPVFACGAPQSKTEDPPARTAEPAREIDPRLVGRWEQDGNKCEVQLAYQALTGYPSETELIIAQGQFERLENHCRIPETSYLQGGLRGGLECWQEGEEYTEEVNVILTSDATLTFNGTPYFKCDNVDLASGQDGTSITPRFRAIEMQASWVIVEYGPQVAEEDVRSFANAADRAVFFFPSGGAPSLVGSTVEDLTALESALSRAAPTGWSYSYLPSEDNPDEFLFSNCLQQPRAADARCGT